MSKTKAGDLPGGTIAAAIVLSLAATLFALSLDMRGILTNIVSSLILIGPSTVVGGVILVKYKARKSETRDSMLFVLAIWQVWQVIPLGERVLATLHGKPTPTITTLGFEDLIPDPLEHPLWPTLTRLENLWVRLDYMINNPVIDQSDMRHWLAESDLLSFPDFPLVSRCLELISDSRAYAWAQFSAERAANWYHTVPIQLVTYPNPDEFFAGVRTQGIVDVKSGVLRAAAAAKLQRDAGRGQIVVDPSEYFTVLMGALSHAIYIVRRIE